MNIVWKALAMDTLEILGPTVVDDYGSEALDWSDPEVLETVEFCSVQATMGPEITGDREAIIMRYQVFMPGFHAVLDGTKRVRWQRTGRAYRIDGDTPYTPDPFGLGLDHHQFIIEEVQG